MKKRKNPEGRRVKKPPKLPIHLEHRNRLSDGAAHVWVGTGAVVIVVVSAARRLLWNRAS